jgi:uncharacterized protein
MARGYTMRFAVDCMLGTLAKWLRILGHDVTYYRAIEDGELAGIAAREGRTLLTADRRLVKRRQARDHVLVTSHDLRRQIAQVLRERRLTIASETLLGRCLRCNTVTETLAPEMAREQVPVYVYRTQERFTRCPQCARVYWRATHVTRMLETLAAAAGSAAAGWAPAVAAARAASTPAPGSRRRRPAPALPRARALSAGPARERTRSSASGRPAGSPAPRSARRRP